MVKTRVQLKIDTAANWETAGNRGFIPKAGEPIYYKAEGGWGLLIYEKVD